MKRVSGLHEKLCTINNINLADSKARKNKKKRYGINKHDLNRDVENKELLESFKNLTYCTSKYDIFKIYEPKEREIFRLPYFPDRIAHHAIMNITERLWVKTFISHTYSCIKKRGIHKCAYDVKKSLKCDPKGTKYCLKLDIRKFYPSIDHSILKNILTRKIKDLNFLTILYEIIDSAPGVPIGNYLSQYLANLFLTYFDHILIEQKHVKHYFRYADDIVILSESKKFLHQILSFIIYYLSVHLNLEIKPNYQIFLVESRGIDFVGYVFFHTHTLLRKSIKQKMLCCVTLYEKGLISKEVLHKKLTSYYGWCKYANCKNLLKQIEQRTGLKYSIWNGKKVNIEFIRNKCIKVFAFIQKQKCFEVHFIYKNKPYFVISNDWRVRHVLKQLKTPVNYVWSSYKN